MPPSSATHVQVQSATTEIIPVVTTDEQIKITDAALVKVINQYCHHEAGVRNLRKCLDRIFRKIVAKMEDKKMIEAPKA